MENVTHTLAGVTIANAFFRDRIGPEAVPVLAIASNWPDLDAFVMLSRDPAAVLMRRTFGHSLILLPFLAAGLACLLKRFYPRLSWKVLFGLSVLGMAGHLLFDLVNSFGVVLLWPVSTWRPELGIVFIIDLALTGILLSPLLACWPKGMRAYLAGFSRASVACVIGYFLFCGVNRIWASQALTKATAGSPVSFSYVFPEPLGPHRWHGVALENGRYEVYLINSLTGQVQSRGSVATQAGDPIVDRARNSPFGRKLDWFFKAPVWSIERKSPDGAEVSAYDLRFRSLVIGRAANFKFRMKVRVGGTVERL